MKKSQATYFLVVGIVITFFMLFSSYVVYQGKKQMSENKPIISLIESMKEDPLNTYLKKCNDYALRKTLLDFGKYAFFPDLNFSGFEVEYIVSRHQQYPGKEVPLLISKIDNILIYESPLYPLNQFNTDPASVDATLLTRIKKRGEIPLFYFGLPNRIMFNLSSLERKYEHILTKIPILPLLTVPKNATHIYSIVRYPGLFVNNTIEYWFINKSKIYFSECLDIDLIEKLTNFDYEIKNITPKVIFQDWDTFLVTEVEYVVNSLVQKNTFKKSIIRSEINFPFSQIYNDLKFGLENDITNLTFNFRKFIENLGRKYNFEVTYFYDSVNSAYIYVLATKDKLYGNSKFILNFAIADRPPVLFYIGDPALLGNPLRINFKVEANSFFYITPIAIDPDDGPVRYVYAPESLCKGRCWKSVPENLWMNSDAYNSDCSDISSYSTSILELIGKKHRCSRVFVTSADAYSITAEEPILGLNTFYLLVADENNKIDFQQIKVLVSSKDFEFLNEKLYDVPQNITSTEDIFFFRFGGASLATQNFFSINISLKNLSNDVEYNELIPARITELLLPYDLSYRNILQNTPNKPTFFNLSMLGSKILEVSLLDNTGKEIIKDQIQLEIKQCLPHRSEIPSYPFNRIGSYSRNMGRNIVGLTEEDLFNYLSNHTCCKDDGTFKSNSELCYKNELFVCGWVLNKSSSLMNFLNIDSSIFSSYRKLFSSYSLNDTLYSIYKVRITSFCSGNRGNICSGDTTEEWIYHTNFKNATLLEHCIGCVYENGNFILYNFTNTTYEKWLRDIHGIGINARGVCRKNVLSNSILYYNSSPIDGAYFYICNLTCNEGKCEKPKEDECIDANRRDSCIGGVLNDYYFDHSGNLRNLTINFEDICKRVSMINDNGKLISMYNQGYAIAGDLCYSMQKLDCNSLENLRKRYPKLSEAIILDQICVLNYQKVNCSLFDSIDNVNFSRGFINGKAIVKKAQLGSNCKFGCQREDCCNIQHYECNLSTLGRAVMIFGKEFYCTYDAFNNKFLWVLNKSTSVDPFERNYLKPKEFCLDNIDNDLDGKIDYEDDDCALKLCVKNNKFGIVLQNTLNKYDCFVRGYLQLISVGNTRRLIYSDYGDFYLDAFTIDLSQIENILRMNFSIQFLNDVKYFKDSLFDTNLTLLHTLENYFNESVLEHELMKRIINIDGSLIEIKNGTLCLNFISNKIVECNEGLSCSKDLRNYLNREFKKYSEIRSSESAKNTYFAILRSKFNFIYSRDECREILFKNTLSNLSFRYYSYLDYFEKKNLFVEKERNIYSFNNIYTNYEIMYNLSLCIIYNNLIPQSIGVLDLSKNCVNATYIITNISVHQIYNRFFNLQKESPYSDVNIGDFILINLNELQETRIFSYRVFGNNLFYCDQFSIIVKNSSYVECKQTINQMDVSKECVSYNCRDFNRCKIKQYGTETPYYVCEFS